ncbi:helix-turn-helix transcriptional regulator [Anaerococcus sp. ENR0831]|uniref:Helix-turn-helix transcriptional regulator n=1 Tax=Anaerococcus martiniensis TaxID=3115615 RepID=A0ABW9MBS4_9FIRM
MGHEICANSTDPLLHTNARFWYIKKGEADFNIQGENYTLKEGMLVGILPWYYTQIMEVMDPIELDVAVFDIELINIFLKKTNQMFGSAMQITNSITENAYVILDEDDRKTVESIIKTLNQELHAFKNGKAYAKQMTCIKIMELAILFEKSAGHGKKKLQKYNKIEIFHYIWAHLDEKLTLADLAHIFYLSESNISKYIKEETGLSFTNLTSLMKLTKLMGYLNFSENNLEELSVILGFKDASHLSKFFKSKTGLNSKDYKNSYHTIENGDQVIDYLEMDDIINYIVKNYYNDLDIDQICKKFDINQNSLNKSLKFYVDKTFDDYINYMRVINAARLLLQSDDLVSVIAYKVGFNTTKTFYRNFKKIYSINPNDFRKKINYQEVNL